ncbi:tail-tape measure protein (endogenous virus) [Clostridium phage phiCT9441A]|uniref:tail length tape measure protein n=1 Tax=Clostridium phage phiCT9441A TaxID=1567014 RepID=UPI000572A910|nr:hypothetical protein [Clostridium tetani]YP_009219424.1 tail length tape measure protein [Clostridium phage phiCT9441A]AJA42671.1 tail-tape measure protein [Clostridium phage phiCT9441A]SUY66156.1 phage protein [Clostridium tetani]
MLKNRKEVIIISTVSASLRMFDQMTRPLQQVTQALNLTISAMDNMNNSANRDIRITNSLNTARGAIQRASAGLQELASSQDRASNRQNNLNNSFNQGTNSANALLNKVKGLASAYLGFQAIKKGIDLTIVGAAKLEQQLITISGMLGNKEVGKAFFGELNKYANISVYGLKEFNTITRSFIQFTKNTDNLMKLNKTAEKLAFLDPTQGLEGAGFALKEALSGDFMSVRQRFGFGKADAEILKASKSMDDFINKFNKLLASKGATDKAMEEFNQSAIAQFNNLKSNIETAFSQAGENALNAVKPILSRINQGFRNGSFQPFFDGINAGITIIANAVVWVSDVIQSGVDIVSKVFNAVLINIENTGIALWALTPIILGLVAAWGTYNAVIFITNALITITHGLMAIWTFLTNGLTFAKLRLASAISIATIKQRLFNLVMSLNPIGIVIGLIIGLITAMLAFGAVTNGIRKTFADAFGYIVDAAQWAVNAVINILNGAIKGINKVSGFFGGLLGIETKQIQEIEYKADFSKFKASGQDFIKNATLDDVKAKFGLDKIGKGSDQSKMPDMNAWNKAQGPGTLGMDDPNKKLKKGNKHLKNIDDKIDVSNEHLEMMRGLAEQESIQNFVTLTPTVQVTTGDIKEEADINKIIDRIESYMENELVNSAEGVYA